MEVFGVVEGNVFRRLQEIWFQNEVTDVRYSE